MKDLKYALFNHHIVSIDSPQILLTHRGLSLGIGLFETMAYQNQRIQAFDYHWRRLKNSAQILTINLPFNADELERSIYELIDKNQHQQTELAIRLTITEGNFKRYLIVTNKLKPNFFITLSLLPIYKKSLSATIVEITRNELSISSKIKSISYLDNFMAKKEAVDAGFDEAILKNTQGYIAESATSNIFIVTNNGTILTPPISAGALPGTYRQRLIENLSKTFHVKEANISIDDLIRANEIFLTNALMQIRPIYFVKDFYENSNFIISEQLASIMNETKT